MKKITLTISLLLGTIVYSQTINLPSIPQEGVTYESLSMDTYYSLANDGPWDFSTVQTVSDSDVGFLPIGLSEYSPTTYPNTTHIKSYYQGSQSVIQFIGFTETGYTYNGENSIINTNYATPVTTIPYPFNVGDIHSDAIYGTPFDCAACPPSMFRDHEVTTEALGSGSVTMPDGTVYDNVVHVSQLQIFTDAQTGSSPCITTRQTNFLWAADLGMALVETYDQFNSGACSFPAVQFTRFFNGIQDCPAPVISSWQMTSDGVIIDGSNSPSATGYQLEYSPNAFTPGDGSATVVEFASFPHTLTGLASGSYYFAMRSVCGDGVYSDYIGPDLWSTSGCPAAYSLPYSNDFEDFDAWQACNTYFDSDGDNNYWNNANFDSDGDGIADNRYAASYSWLNGTILFPDNWVIFGPIDLTNVNDAELTWKAMGGDPDWCSENYSVYIGTEPTVSNLLGSAVSFNETFPPGTPGPGGVTPEPGCGLFAERSLDISAMVGNEVYIGFRHHNVSDMFVLLVDDLAVTSESLGVQDIEQALMNYFYDDVTKAVTINSSNAPLSELIVYNMLGQVVSEKTTTKSSETIDMSTFDKGVYIIKAFSELGTKTMRVINY